MAAAIEAIHQLTYPVSAATWPFTALSTILFGMRTVSRFHLQKEAIGWDDLVISLSWVLDIVRATSLQLAVDASRKIELANLPETVPSAVFWVVFTNSWSFLSIAIPKLGIGILLCRVFRPSRGFQILVLTFCVFLNILATVGFIISFVQCDPVPGQWNLWKYPEAKCWNRSIQMIYACTTGGFSALMDMGFSVWPGFVIWGLHMPTWRRLSTMALMGLGIASFAFAVVKLIANTALLGDPGALTVLHGGIYIGIWNSIENDFVLSAACLPAVPPFFRACKRAFMGKQTRSSPTAYKTSFDTMKLGDLPGRQVGNSTVELVSNSQMPGVWTNDCVQPYSQVFGDQT